MALTEAFFFCFFFHRFCGVLMVVSCCFEVKVVQFLGAVLKAKWCSFGEKMALFLKVKWCCFGDKTGAVLKAKWCCFGYCLAAVLGTSCWLWRCSFGCSLSVVLGVSCWD